ncbi:MAG: REP-associated tyrosine transposase [Pseudomonadota bacterium]|jgi:putative transposase
MSRYLRPRIAGASIFFTVGLERRGGSLLIDNISVLRDAVRQTRRERWFTIDAWVVLPDHMHCVWTLPEGDSDYSLRWSVIKARFSRQMAPVPRRASMVARRERSIWQRRFWEHHLRSEEDWKAAIAYCWMNPVKHGLADRPEDWPYSSINRP